MPLLSLRDVHFTFSGPALLDGISIEIEKGERIGLVGRNGAGKSTLMKIMVGELAPDDGEVLTANGLRVARLIQEVPDGGHETAAEIVAAGYREASIEDADDSVAPEHDWRADQAVERVLSRLKLDGTVEFRTLSSGMKRRVLLARALVTDPDVLLLDEPTNHLDIDSIAWLEGFLKSFNGTLIFVTHDRAFLRALATRIMEVDRGQLFDWTCDYDTFLHRKQLALHAEEKQNAHFDRKLAEEEVWIRQGIKARRTRNEGRVRALKAMRVERSLRRKQVGNVAMRVSEAERSGQLVLEAKHVGFQYGERPIIRDLSLLLMRGDKVGIIGPNGAGKSTLLKLLLDELQPTSGTMRHGTNRQVIYFDQLREQIQEDKTVIENVGEGQEHLVINGERRHIYGYLQDFLFTPERARRPARFLSGGERNRLLLARIFKRPCNLMVLDEPTNDLDAETLELLEELVTNFNGTMLLVSHDRAFLNNVVTSTLVFEGDGVVREYDGGYDDYLRQKAAANTEDTAASTASKKATLSDFEAATPAVKKSKGPRLSWKEERELEAIPERIDSLEKEQAALQATMSNPEFFKRDKTEIARTTERLAESEAELMKLMERWEELDSRA